MSAWSGGHQGGPVLRVGGIELPGIVVGVISQAVHGRVKVDGLVLVAPNSHACCDHSCEDEVVHLHWMEEY